MWVDKLDPGPARPSCTESYNRRHSVKGVSISATSNKAPEIQHNNSKTAATATYLHHHEFGDLQLVFAICLFALSCCQGPLHLPHAVQGVDDDGVGGVKQLWMVLIN